MNRRAINFNSLRAFEAAARHLSMTRAAEELRVTHAAISHQVRMLEARLGLPLFQRTRRGVMLTAAGNALLPVLEDSLNRISEALETIVATTGHQVLAVTTTPSFALQWLVPRLGTLRGPADGGFEVHLRPTLRMLDVAHGEVDVAIRCGIPPWPGLKAELVMPAHMTPVCSPKLLHGLDLPLKPADLLKLTLLHADVGNIPIGNEWRTWLHVAGLARRGSLPGLSFQDPALAFQGAISGAGVAMGYVELLGNELLSGELVRPFDLAVRHMFAYYLAYPTSRENEPAIGEFRRWIFDQVALDATKTASRRVRARPNLASQKRGPRAKLGAKIADRMVRSGPTSA